MARLAGSGVPVTGRVRDRDRAASVMVNQDATDGSLRLTTTESAESLSAAPHFKTLAMIQAERDAANQPTGSITPNSTTPAPAYPQ
ncbi:hypothetical protein [Ferirhizobium litorale]|uniref:hypothetical protein n=1 Tax=Ferirhizobium litorale TaxID=2927786 RepID=UPI0035301CB1